ncbi:LarC family nickel insertion protein [Eubacterium sp. 1001713B170207_170306_E7]|uniref:LarC family nickel insertion protein n=1 Tax=Eubacterium sp. 1001713B170207_170306_E7 TaxID=2787097 RepID=UPI001896C16D|nr:LarC family nickel insertion protein [Eubacterium sp. 1001713B170207_170306_E7]
MRTLYLECYSGISGDMFTAALLDLGADRERLLSVLDTIPAEGFQIKIDQVRKAGLDICDFEVILDKQHENHDHDMDYLYGEDNKEQDQHQSEEAHGAHFHHDHSHRGMKEIRAILAQTEMSEKAAATALRIFTILGEAEAEAHGTTLEAVHFHEVGALDSIADIVAASVCMEDLGIDEVVIPVVYEGRGSIRCQHGVLPVPVPAVTCIAEMYGLPLHITEQREGELITPTGAAIAAAIKTNERLPKRFRILKTGIGSGKRSYKTPSLLRAMLIEEINETYVFSGPIG